MHDVVIVGIPLIAILAGILFSRSDNKDLRTEMRNEIQQLRTEVKELRREVLTHLDRIDADLRQFYHLTGRLESRMSHIEKDR